MSACELLETPDVELYFYDELSPADRDRVGAHLRTCAACRQRLDDLHAIRRALADVPVVDAPPAGDWSGFTRRLDEAVGLARPAARQPAVVLEQSGGAWRARHLVAFAAMLAIVAIGVLMASRVRSPRPVDTSVQRGGTLSPTAPTGGQGSPAAGSHQGATLVLRKDARVLREVSAEHLERSKLVVLGLATRDPRQTHAADWQFERQLAGTLLPETRLYRLTAQERGVPDVARVMRDLETVFIEASMTDGHDRESLARVQRLIARRGLVSKMQIVATSGL
jgi:anti-sigma factor RsiW